MIEVVAVVLALVASGLAAVVLRQRRRLRQLARFERAVRDTTGPGASRERDVIVVEVRNHVELAVDRTPLARLVTAVSPDLIRSIVHRETVKELRAQLASEGVDAEVRLLRLAASGSRPDGADDRRPRDRADQG